MERISTPDQSFVGQFEFCLLTARLLDNMAHVTVISTGDFQIRWNVLSLSFSERESGKRPLRLSDFYHNYLMSDDHTQHSGKISICNT